MSNIPCQPLCAGSFGHAGVHKRWCHIWLQYLVRCTRWSVLVASLTSFSSSFWRKRYLLPICSSPEGKKALVVVLKRCITPMYFKCGSIKLIRGGLVRRNPLSIVSSLLLNKDRVTNHCAVTLCYLSIWPGTCLSIPAMVVFARSPCNHTVFVRWQSTVSKTQRNCFCFLF